jgi:hypothetical protein
MTLHETSEAIRTPELPRPRQAMDGAVPAEKTRETPRVGEFLWPEPWHFSRGTRPPSEFWDAETAGWRSSGPVAPPRTGD